MLNLLSTNIRIVQTAKGRTGSTLLTNILLGLFCSDNPVYFVSEEPPFSNIANFFIDNFIIKAHSSNFQEYVNSFPEYKLYFVESTRNGRMFYPSTNGNHIQIDYEYFVENKTQSLITTIKNVTNKLTNFLPEEIIANMDINSAVTRIQNMNKFYEENLKDKPWRAEADYMYGLHGSHKNRDSKK